MAEIISGVESGDRESFLANLRDRLAEGAPPDPHSPHPIPPLPDQIPNVNYVPKAENIVDDFVAHAEAVKATVHRPSTKAISPDLFEQIAADVKASTVVFSAHEELQDLVDVAKRIGLEVLANDPAESMRADLGVTVADAAIAGTGSIVQSSTAAGSRSVSILCKVHLALVHSQSIVATPAEVLRPRVSPDDMPPNLVLITGPSRTGDIEQILTVGAHGPIELHLVVLD